MVQWSTENTLATCSDSSSDKNQFNPSTVLIIIHLKSQNILQQFSGSYLIIIIHYSDQGSDEYIVILYIKDILARFATEKDSFIHLKCG